MLFIKIKTGWNQPFFFLLFFMIILWVSLCSPEDMKFPSWVTKFIDRILDLGGEVKVEDRPAAASVADPIEYVKCDLKRQNEGLEVLRKCVA